MLMSAAALVVVLTASCAWGLASDFGFAGVGILRCAGVGGRGVGDVGSWGPVGAGLAGTARQGGGRVLSLGLQLEGADLTGVASSLSLPLRVSGSCVLESAWTRHRHG
jgi:hypothetical protein